jgi:hypothetical protein
LKPGSESDPQGEKLDPDPHQIKKQNPDPHQGDKSNAAPHQRDADLQHSPEHIGSVTCPLT